MNILCRLFGHRKEPVGAGASGRARMVYEACRYCGAFWALVYIVDPEDQT